MTEETLKKANEIKKRIDKLQNEINRLPRSLLSSIYNKYSKRILIREYKLKFLGDVLQMVLKWNLRMKI